MAIELSQVQPRNSVDDFVVLTREDLSDQVLEFCGEDVFCLDSKALKKKMWVEKLVEVESDVKRIMLGQFVATSADWLTMSGGLGVGETRH